MDEVGFSGAFSRAFGPAKSSVAAATGRGRITPAKPLTPADETQWDDTKAWDDTKEWVA